MTREGSEIQIDRIWSGLRERKQELQCYNVIFSSDDTVGNIGTCNAEMRFFALMRKDVLCSTIEHTQRLGAS